MILALPCGESGCAAVNRRGYRPETAPRAERSGVASASPLLHDTSFFSIPMAGRGPRLRKNQASPSVFAPACGAVLSFSRPIYAVQEETTAGPPQEIGGYARRLRGCSGNGSGQTDRAVPRGAAAGDASCRTAPPAPGYSYPMSRGGTGPNRANPLLRGRSAQSSPAARRFSSAGPGPGRTARRAAVKNAFFQRVRRSKKPSRRYNSIVAKKINISFKTCLYFKNFKYYTIKNISAHCANREKYTETENRE